MKKVQLWPVALVAAAVVAGCASPRIAEVSEPVTIQLLHFADVDGNESAALGSVADFSALVNGFRNDPVHGLNTIVVSSGDNIIPGPRYSLAGDPLVTAVTGGSARGHADIAFLNELGVVASAVGNHELDQGPTEFAMAIAADGTFDGAQFPHLSANLDFGSERSFSVGRDGSDYRDLAGEVAASATVTVGGQTIGLVGASTPTLAAITSTGRIGVAPGAGWSVEDLAAAIQPAVDDLIDRGVNKIILLAHMQQIAVERELAPLLTGVDIIVAGGSNTLLADSDDVLREDDEAADTYPLRYTSAAGEPVLVVNVDGDYQYLGRLVVGFDAAGVIDPASLDPALNGAWAATPEIAAEVGGAPSAQVIAIRDALTQAIDSTLSTVVGFTDVPLAGERAQVRTEETNMGNLTADANLWYANLLADGTVDVSFKNGGGIRAAIDSGEVTLSEVVGTLRFNNGLVLMSVTGAELKEILESAFAGVAPGATPGSFPQIAGMWVGFDPTQPARDGNAGVAGQRVQYLSIVDQNGNLVESVVEDGQVVGDGPYRMVTLNFLANGGDGFGWPDPNGSGARSNLYAGPNGGDPEDYPDESRDADPGNSSFAQTGFEQDAFAEYFAAFYPDAANAFDTAELAPAQDLRVQNLSVRSWQAP